MEYSLTIYHLYPDLLNLYGDKGQYCRAGKAVPLARRETRVKTRCEGRCPTSDADIVLLGGGLTGSSF